MRWYPMIWMRIALYICWSMFQNENNNMKLLLLNVYGFILFSVHRSPSNFHRTYTQTNVLTFVRLLL